jgi:hypothetical protein
MTLIASPAQAQQDRVSGTEKGNVLFFSKIELRWDAAGTLIQDTFVSLINDGNESVKVQMYFVNGDGYLAQVNDPATGLCWEREHPGWNRVSTEITLTPNQPTYWSAESGTGSAGGAFPITVPPFADSLDPAGCGNMGNANVPGRPALDGTTDRVMRGFIVGFAVDASNQELAYNHLSGSAVLVNYQRFTAWEYQAWAHQSVGAVTADGVLNLDGNEYSLGFDLLLIDFYRPGSTALSRVDPALTVTVETDLTLHAEDFDATQGSSPVTTKAKIDVWNENETKFDNLDRCITCWDQTLLRDYAGFGVPNNFVNLGTNKGKARVDGVAGDGVCDVFDETEGPCGTLSTDICGQAAALLGVVAKHLTFGTTNYGAAGMNLVGMGTQAATIQYTPLGPPPTATGDGLDAEVRDIIERVDREVQSMSRRGR